MAHQEVAANAAQTHEISSPNRHRTFVEIDVAALRSNLRLLNTAVGLGHKVMLVVKSDAYGHGPAPSHPSPMRRHYHCCGR
jgi:hypothetical protein